VVATCRAGHPVSSALCHLRRGKIGIIFSFLCPSVAYRYAMSDEIDWRCAFADWPCKASEVLDEIIERLATKAIGVVLKVYEFISTQQ
jgi:hypothetical protein